MTTSVPTHRMCSEEHGGAMFAGQHCPSPVCVAERTPASPVDAVTEAWPRAWPCPGLEMPRPDWPNGGPPACDLAGHACTIRTEHADGETHVLCVCCGEGYGFQTDPTPGGYAA